MQRGQSLQKRLPWWCWLVIMLLVITALPSAALLAWREPQASIPPRELWSNLQVGSYELVRRQYDSTATAADVHAEELTTQAVDVSDLFPALQEQIGESEPIARDFLITMLQHTTHRPQKSHETVDSSPSFTWSGDSLVVRHTKHGHESVAQQLALLREHGFAELCVEVRVLSGPAAVLNPVGADWKLIGGTNPVAPATDHPTTATNENASASISGTVEAIVEKQVPALVALIDEAQVRKMLSSAQNHPTTNIIFAPKVTVFNGQSARIEDCTQRPFVVGVKPAGEGKLEPQIRVVTEGTSIRVRPELHKDQCVQLNVSVTLNSVKDVETAHFSVADGQLPIAVQVPEVTTMRVQSSVTMGLDQFLAISVPATKTGKQQQPLCVLVTVRKLDGPFVTSTTAEAAQRGDASDER